MLHVTDIQYMFVKWNGRNWEKNAMERNGMGEETQRNGTGQGKKHYRTERLVVHIPVSLNRHPVARIERGNFFNAYCMLYIIIFLLGGGRPALQPRQVWTFAHMQHNGPEEDLREG